MSQKIITLIITILVLFGLLCVIKDYKANASNEWTQETQKKFDNLVHIGFPLDIASDLIVECKRTAKDPVNCIKIGASILGAESSMGIRCHRNNCTGMNDGGVSYSSKTEGIRKWVNKYNKWWYKQTTPASFYRADGIPPKTRYCMGPKRDGVCVNGAKNSWKVFNSINF